MNLTIILGLVAFFCIFIVIWVQKQRASDLQKLKKAQIQVNDLNTKLENTRSIVGQVKSELQKKDLEIAESRKYAQKKMRKDAKAEQDMMEHETTNEITNSDNKLHIAMQVMETQLQNTTLQAQEEKAKIEQELTQKYKSDLEQKQSEIDSLKKRLDSLKNTKKKGLRVNIDVETLPENVINELARLYRKAQQHERLYALANGKIKMSQERFWDLQKKYYDVCREFAIALGNSNSKELSEIELEQIAHKAVQNSAVASEKSAEVVAEAQPADEDTQKA